MHYNLDFDESDYHEEPLLPLNINSYKETINEHKKLEKERERKKNIKFLYDNREKRNSKNKDEIHFNNIKQTKIKRVTTEVKNNRIYKIISLYNKINDEYNLNLSIGKNIKTNESLNKKTVIDISNIRKEYYNINETLGNILYNEKDNESKIENISNNDNNNVKISSDNINDFSKRKELELLKQKIAISVNQNKSNCDKNGKKIKGDSTDKSTELIKLNSAIINDENENYVKQLIDLNIKKGKEEQENNRYLKNDLNENLSHITNGSDYSYSFSEDFANINNSEVKTKASSSVNSFTNNLKSFTESSSIPNPIINNMIDSLSLLINNNSIRSTSNSVMTSGQLVKSSLNMIKSSNHSIEGHDESKFSKLYDNLKSMSLFNVPKSQDIESQNNCLKNKTPNRALRRMLFEKITNMDDKNESNEQQTKTEDKQKISNVSDDTKNISANKDNNMKKNINKSNINMDNRNTRTSSRHKRKKNNDGIKKGRKIVESNINGKHKTKKKTKFKKVTPKFGNKKKKQDKKVKEDNNNNNDKDNIIKENWNISNENDSIRLNNMDSNNRLSLNSIGFQNDKQDYEFESDDEVQEYSEFEPEYLKKMKFDNNEENNDKSEKENKVINAYIAENCVNKDIPYGELNILKDQSNFSTIDNNSSYSSLPYLNATPSSNPITNSNTNYYNSSKYNKPFDVIIEEDNEYDENYISQNDNHENSKEITNINSNENEQENKTITKRFNNKLSTIEQR